MRPSQETPTPSQNVVSALILVLLLGVLAFGIQQLVALNRTDDDINARRAAVAAASTEVRALTSVSASTTDADLTKILDGATSDFRTQFKAQADVFRKSLQDAKVTSKASIVSAGLVSHSDTTATVLVAATGTVTNAKSTDAQPRNYRLRVDLTLVSGNWLVSGMDFV